MRIKLTGIFVDDQDRAKAFYTEKLGFDVKVDAAYGEGTRWLSLVSPEDPDGPEVLLEIPNDAARTYRAAVRNAGKPWTAFTTEDAQADYERLAAQGVEFTLAPTKMPYGGIDSVLDDTCGNLICLHQD